MSEPDSTLAIASKLSYALTDFQAASRDLENILAQPIEFVFQVRVSESINLKLSRGAAVKLAEESVRNAIARVNTISEEFKNATHIDPPRGGRDDM